MPPVRELGSLGTEAHRTLGLTLSVSKTRRIMCTRHYLRGKTSLELCTNRWISIINADNSVTWNHNCHVTLWNNLYHTNCPINIGCFEFNQKTAIVCFHIFVRHIFLSFFFFLFNSLDFASWPESLKYLPSGPLQKKLANVCCVEVLFPIPALTWDSLNDANQLNQNWELPSHRVLNKLSRWFLGKLNFENDYFKN